MHRSTNRQTDAENVKQSGPAGQTLCMQLAGNNASDGHLNYCLTLGEVCASFNGIFDYGLAQSGSKS